MANLVTPLPADLPENWQANQIIAPNGTDVGLSQQHGYNYQSEAINLAQKGVNAALADLAPIESSPATAVHAAGTHLIYNGQLYNVTTAISIGDTLTVGTNIVASDLASAIASTVTSFNSRTGAVTPQSGDYTAAMVGAQADLGFIEDTTYSGCLYRNVTVGGQTVREWVNPPLVAGTEYRTTERFNGKPVYAKAYSITDSSKLPSASDQVKNTNLSIANLETIISVAASGVWHNTASNLISHAVLPYRNVLYAYSSYGSNGSQYIEVMAGTLPANVVIDSVFAVIKYTKSTD